jgi:hypothetical protein
MLLPPFRKPSLIPSNPTKLIKEELKTPGSVSHGAKHFSSRRNLQTQPKKESEKKRRTRESLTVKTATPLNIFE